MTASDDPELRYQLGVDIFVVAAVASLATRQPG